MYIFRDLGKNQVPYNDVLVSGTGSRINIKQGKYE